MVMMVARTCVRLLGRAALALGAAGCSATDVYPSALDDIIPPFEAARIVREGIRPLDILTGDDLLDSLPARSVLPPEAELKPLVNDAAWFSEYLATSNTGFLLLGSLVGEPAASLKGKLDLYGVEGIRVTAGRAEIEQLGFGEVMSKAAFLSPEARRALVDEGRGMVVAVLYVYGLRIEFLDARGAVMDLDARAVELSNAEPAGEQVEIAVRNVRAAMGIIKGDARVAVGFRVHVPTEAERETIQNGFVKAEIKPLVGENVRIGSDRARLVEGDWEVHSDDWTRVVIHYELKPSVDKKGVGCFVSMEVSEMQENKRFHPGKTRILTSKTVPIAVLDDKSQFIVKGFDQETLTEDQETYYLRGRLSGWIPLGDLGALRDIEVSVDGSGSGDRRRQGFKAQLHGVALVGNALD